MTVAQLNTSPSKSNMEDFALDNSRPLYATGISAVEDILPMIRAMACVLEAGFRDPGRDADPPLVDMNPGIIASACQGIGYLASIAAFHVENR